MDGWVKGNECADEMGKSRHKTSLITTFLPLWRLLDSRLPCRLGPIRWPSQALTALVGLEHLVEMMPCEADKASHKGVYHRSNGLPSAGCKPITMPIAQRQQPCRAKSRFSQTVRVMLYFLFFLSQNTKSGILTLWSRLCSLLG